MADDAVEELLDGLWRMVRGKALDPAAPLRTVSDPSVVVGARAQANAQQQALAAQAAAETTSRRDRRRAAADAETYVAIVRLCDEALAAANPPAASPNHGTPPPVVLAPPLLAVEVVANVAGRPGAKLVRFTTIPRAGDRLTVAPLDATVEAVVWSLDTNDVAVPTAMCRVAKAHDPKALRGHGWEQRGSS